MGTSQSISCKICKKQTTKAKHCEKCKENVCEKCYDFPILRQNQQFSLKKAKFQSVCFECFKPTTTIDFNQYYEIVGDENKKEIILIHGAGSCRKMFLPHARKLAQRGYRCILIDLPAHGSRYRQDLTFDNCLKSIKEAKAICKSEDVTIIGGSLGGYVLMDCLGKQQNLCSKAVVMMAGQNVGTDRSMLASVGLWAIEKSTKVFSQALIAENFLKAASGNVNLDIQMIKELSQGGTYFRDVDGNIKVLKQSNPRVALEKATNVKCLFLNGSKDYRDSEQIWLNAAAKGSNLIVYDQADHFFSHDKRFFEKIIQDIDSFIKNA